MFQLHQKSVLASRVAVLCGGNSAERNVSLESGAAVFAALTARGHLCQRIDPAETDLRNVDWNAFETAFLALHGTFGEDGQIQNLLDQIGIPYTGSNAVASALAFRKAAAKDRFRLHGLATPWSTLIHKSQAAAVTGGSHLKLPVVVKPEAQGSSVGVTIVDAADELTRALDECFRYDDLALIEQYIPGTEWTVAVLNGRPLFPIQICTSRGFYDYKAKYADDETQLQTEHSQPDSVIQNIRHLGASACEVLGCSGAVRADIRLDENQHPWLLEVNTIPGLTSHSLLPLAAQQAGLSFAELCESMLRTAIVPENPSSKTLTYPAQIRA